MEISGSQWTQLEPLLLRSLVLATGSGDDQTGVADGLLIPRIEMDHPMNDGGIKQRSSEHLHNSSTAIKSGETPTIYLLKVLPGSWWQGNLMC